MVNTVALAFEQCPEMNIMYLNVHRFLSTCFSLYDKPLIGRHRPEQNVQHLKNRLEFWAGKSFCEMTCICDYGECDNEITQIDLERARFLLTEALDEDEKGDMQDAIDLYTEAVELCIKIVSPVYY